MSADTAPSDGVPDGGNDRTQVNFDADGYFLTRLGQEGLTPAQITEAGVKLALATHDELDNIGTVHYLLRSAFIVPQLASADVVNEYHNFSEGCLYRAVRLLSGIQNTRHLPPPRWVSSFQELAGQVFKDRRSDIERITVTATLNPRLYARSMPAEEKIQVSAVSREHLRSINLAVWNLVFQVTDHAMEQGKAYSQSDWDASFAQQMNSVMPYLISAHKSVNLSILPTLRSYSSSAIFQASISTQIQLTFMLAHEYAHILLDHGPRPQGEQVENEADEFAMQILWSRQSHYGKGDVWIALRWLFHLLALDRIVGEIIYEGDIDWRQVAIANRSRRMLEYVNLEQDIDARDRGIETLGTKFYLDAYAVLTQHQDEVGPLATQWHRATATRHRDTRMSDGV